ncbi:hypothetical protein [Kitasatospora purpeofusca]|uniref:hypothetical protein n=1 Tax=Kitasatospora purpeofusca TaxID=67352 RepID=UPI0036D2A4C1
MNSRHHLDVLLPTLLIATASLATVPLPPHSPRETTLLVFSLVFLSSVTAGVTAAEPYVRRAATRRASH